MCHICTTMWKMWILGYSGALSGPSIIRPGPSCFPAILSLKAIYTSNIEAIQYNKPSIMIFKLSRERWRVWTRRRWWRCNDNSPWARYRSPASPTTLQEWYHFVQGNDTNQNRGVPIDLLGMHSRDALCSLGHFQNGRLWKWQKQ